MYLESCTNFYCPAWSMERWWTFQSGLWVWAILKAKGWGGRGLCYKVFKSKIETLCELCDHIRFLCWLDNIYAHNFTARWYIAHIVTSLVTLTNLIDNRNFPTYVSATHGVWQGSLPVHPWKLIAPETIQLGPECCFLSLLLFFSSSFFMRHCYKGLRGLWFARIKHRSLVMFIPPNRLAKTCAKALAQGTHGVS